MTALLISCLFGATVFVEQEIDGIRLTAPDSLTGAMQLNFRTADINQDGATDLIFPDRVLFQRDGLYPAGSHAELPPGTAGAVCDLFDNRLYARLPDALIVYRWEREAWAEQSRQEIVWPDFIARNGSDTEAQREFAPEMARFERFLLDIDQDAKPEIVLYARDGIHLFRSDDGAYGKDVMVNVYPPFTAMASHGQALWPAGDRTLSVPGQSLDLQLIWRRGQLCVIARQELRSGLVRFRAQTYAPVAGQALFPTPVVEYPPLPAGVRPIYLNGDDTLDFAGAAPAISTASAFPTPIYETMATTDGGRTLQKFKSSAYFPRCSFVDIDGDGDLDMIVERTGVTSGGLRESLNRFFFQRIFEHEVGVRIQDASGIFAADVTMRRSFPIYLNKVPYRDGGMFRRYKAGDLVDLTGDYNGDKLKDLLVQDSEDRLVIYMSRAYRFSKRPIHVLDVDPDERFYVTDLDADGLSDILLILPDAESGGERSRVYLARETGT